MFKKTVTEEDFKSALQQIEQRMHFMEQKNALLEQKIIKLESDNYFLRSELESKSSQLEKRITDFTDVWHPMMMENVNRIKSELVDEVESKNSLAVENFKHDFRKDMFLGVIFNSRALQYLPDLEYDFSFHDLKIIFDLEASRIIQQQYYRTIESYDPYKPTIDQQRRGHGVHFNVYIFYKKVKIYDFNNIVVFDYNERLPHSETPHPGGGFKMYYRKCELNFLKLLYNAFPFICFTSSTGRCPAPGEKRDIMQENSKHLVDFLLTYSIQN